MLYGGCVMKMCGKEVFKNIFVLFFLFFLLALLFPYMGDDWTWGSTMGLDRLRIFFDNYNGRYLGNLLVLALTRSKLLDAVVMAMSYTLTCFACYQYAKEKSPWLLWFAVILFFLMPKEIFAQAIVWTAGYCNYVPSAVISVVFLLSVRNITGLNPPVSEKKPGKIAMMFLLGFCGALFVENVTVFHICFAAGIILYTFFRFRKYYYAHFSFLSGAMIGACVMFSNSVYHEIAVGDDTYRHVPHSIYGLVDYVIEHANVILSYIIYNNLLICGIATALLVVLALSGDKEDTGFVGKRYALAAFHLFSFLLICFKKNIFGFLWYQFSYSTETGFLLEVLLALLYVFSIFLMILCFVEKGRKFRMLLPLYCVAGSLMPLLVVDPLGPRCMFVGYLLMMVFIVDLAGYLSARLALREKWLSRIVCLILAVQVLVFANIFYSVHYYNTLRLETAKKQAEAGKQTILVSDLPHSEYLWNCIPEKKLEERYKMFYGLDESLQFEIISYEKLKDLPENNQ